jgi:Fe-S-cluster containining protein
LTDKTQPPLTGDPPGALPEKIIGDSPRLGPDDTFTFACRPGISCFNKCCGDVNIFLSPYDVLRMKQRLGLTSSEFLEQYTLMPVQKDMRTPVVMLRMNDDESKTCPFLTEAGCGIYSDRPWPCRMYPLGLAASKDTPDGWQGERFYFLLKEEGCRGHEEPQECTVRQWFEDQGIEEYDRWGEQFKELTLHKYFEDGGVLSPEKMHMFFTACYDLDKFREFVFESTLLQRFDVDEDFVEEMRGDDEALLRFAFLWLRFSLFGEPTVRAKAEVVEAFKGKLEKKKLFEKKPVTNSAKESP